MRKGKIIITIDYEIFGDGSGDVKSCMIEPTERILAIADKYNVPVTIMAEMCEYNAFKEEQRQNSFPDGYKPALWIEDQLKTGVKAGHDVQLHLHPQWMHYEYNDKWIVDFKYWNISSLPYEKICDLLKKGKTELEELLRPVKKDYECFVFRAGSWGIQPEADILKALAATGFRVDTTVAPGCFFKSQLSNYDFRGLPRKAYWYIERSLNEDLDTGILELPICARRYHFHDKLYYKMLRKLRKIRPLIIKSGGNIASKTRGSFIKKLFPAQIMLDICEMSAVEMIAMLEYACNTFKHLDAIPIVAIGHPKAFNNAQDYELFIQNALEKGYEFVTFAQVMGEISND